MIIPLELALTGVWVQCPSKKRRVRVYVECESCPFRVRLVREKNGCGTRLNYTREEDYLECRAEKKEAKQIG